MGPQRGDYLGAELGADLDAHGEPVSIDVRNLTADRELRQLARRLWQDHQRRSGKPPRRLLADAGMEPAELWLPGVTESLYTCSTEEELNRYRKRLQFRADLLEALLAETLRDLERALALKHLPATAEDQTPAAGRRKSGRRKRAPAKARRRTQP